jgi:hypothetical protein
MLRQFFAQAVVFRRGFGGWFFRHCTVLLCTPLFEVTAKTTISAIKAVAASRTFLFQAPECSRSPMILAFVRKTMSQKIVVTP